MSDLLPLQIWVKKETVVLNLFQMEMWLANDLDPERFPRRRTNAEWAEALAAWRTGKLL